MTFKDGFKFGLGIYCAYGMVMFFVGVGEGIGKSIKAQSSKNAKSERGEEIVHRNNDHKCKMKIGF